MGETKKVKKEISFKYHIFPNVIVSPSRLEILNKLFDSPEGLSYDELVEKMSEKEGVQRHLDVLLKDNIIENKSGRYTLSKYGQDFYYDLGKAALKVKEEGLLSNP
jgi:DNA-binding transcriptional ArsR family regulator